MKMYSNSRWEAARPSWRWQILCAGLVCANALLVAGCSKQSQSSTSSASTPQGANASQSTPAATVTNGQPDLRPINRALMQWVMQNHRAPANFEEFAASAGISIPPPPPGKKYVINSHGLINLVNAN
jgi:hypothetical protein